MDDPALNPVPSRILIVDDQPANLQVLGSVLGRLGYEIVPATDGVTALKRLALRPVDLVLLDLLMPGMDGFEVCRRIRENPAWAGLPVIFLSAADEKTLIVRALECGGVDFVTKPFNQAELLLRVRTHLTLKLTRDRLQQVAEDKDELLGILTHDLKNALGGIQISTELLAERAGNDEALQRLSMNILESTSRMQVFVREFLANAAAEHSAPPTLSPVDLTETANEVVRDFQAAARRKGLEIQTEMASDTPTVLADAIALRRVLENLLSNAIKFSPAGRTIHVEVRSEAHTAECRIRDQGPGFTAEDRTKMFRRYGRLSARPTAGEPSTGLGLSIVRKLVTEQGGKLICDSEPGNGATMIVQLQRVG